MNEHGCTAYDEATHNHDCCCLCQVSSIAAVICVVVISHIISSHHQVVLRAGLPNQTICCGSVQTDDAQQTTLHHSGQVQHRNTVVGEKDPPPLSKSWRLCEIELHQKLNPTRSRNTEIKIGPYQK